MALKEKTLNGATLLLSLLLYIVSLTQMAFCAGSCTMGMRALLLGPLGIITEVGCILSYVLAYVNSSSYQTANPVGATFVWLANPMWLMALIFFVVNKKVSLVLSTVSALIMLCFLFFTNVVSANESGTYTAIQRIGAGYWLWVLSAVVIVLASVAGLFIYKKPTA